MMLLPRRIGLREHSVRRDAREYIVSDQISTPPPASETDAPAPERDSLPAAPDMSTPVGKALLSLTRALMSATSSAVDSAATAAYDAQMTALKPLAGNPVIDEAIAKLTREHELSTLSARKTAAYAIRQQYADAFTELARYGLPDAVKPAGKTGAVKTGAGAPAIPTDADGATYTKTYVRVSDYRVAGARSCGTCPVSIAVSGAPAITKAGNFRQNITRAIAKMSSAEVDAHAQCFESARDAEAAYFGNEIQNVTSYVRNA
jgi:hypothetical protein